MEMRRPLICSETRSYVSLTPPYLRWPRSSRPLLPLIFFAICFCSARPYSLRLHYAFLDRPRRRPAVADRRSRRPRERRQAEHRQQACVCGYHPCPTFPLRRDSPAPDLPFFATRTSDPVLVEHFWRRQIWWGVVFEVESEYIPLAASPVASHGQLYPITYRRRYFGFPEISFDVPFDRNGRCVPQPRCCRVFTHAISGTHRPPELDQGVINTILRGATEAWASKKASYTVESYLQQHPAESVPLRYVARDIEYASLVYSLAELVEPFADFAPRRVAQDRQDRLQRCIEEKKRKEKKRKEKTTPFGVTLMRSQVLYRAAQVYRTVIERILDAARKQRSGGRSSRFERSV